MVKLRECNCMESAMKSMAFADAKRGLAETIKSQGRNLSSAYISGNKISYVLQDAISRKKLI